MKIRRIKSIKINSYKFKVKWDKTYSGASFDYSSGIISIGVKNTSDEIIFNYILHELHEIVAVEMNVRLRRPDCDSDFIFIYDHRQMETMTNIFAGLVSQFIV